MKKIILILIIGAFVSCNQGGSQNDKQTENPMALVKDTIYISGMHCDMCVSSIEKGVGEVEGVEYVKAILNDSMAVVHFDSTTTGVEEIESAVTNRGYSVKKEF